MRAFVEELLDAVFPPRCPLCGDRAEGGGGCDAHALPGALPGGRCDRCASRLPDALPNGERCAACRRSPPRFRRVVALGDWRQEAVREWVLAFKHGGRRDLAGPLGFLLARRWARSEGVGERGEIGEHGEKEGARRRGFSGRVLLVPVPLHPLRLAERGYDQAWLLAREVSERSGVAVRRVLRRCRWTATQGAPGARSRAANVRGAFRLARGGEGEIEGARVWLVDDVTTSASTVNACAAELLGAGAREVGVLCVGRA